MGEYVIDRFEGNIAVLVSKLDSSVRNVERGALPERAAAGWTVYENGGAWSVDPGDTLSRMERVRQKMTEVFRR